MVYLLLFVEFFKIGLFTFGGGYAMIPLIRQTVLNYGWLTENTFYDFLGVCESTPGPIAVNMATFIGSSQGGFFGSLLATLGVVLPSFIIILLVATILTKMLKNTYCKAFLDGIKPVVVALILSAGIVLVAKCFGYTSLSLFVFDLRSIICFGVLTAVYLGCKLIFHKKLNSIVFIFMSAVVGIVVCSLI